jgi:hypothetical protein
MEQTYAVHAQTAVTFASVLNTVDGGDVGVSPGTSITMVESLVHRNGNRNGITTRGTSSAFAAHVRDAHSNAMNNSPDSTTVATEMGGREFGPETKKDTSAINIAFGTKKL